MLGCSRAVSLDFRPGRASIKQGLDGHLERCFATGHSKAPTQFLAANRAKFVHFFGIRLVRCGINTETFDRLRVSGSRPAVNMRTEPKGRISTLQWIYAKVRVRSGQTVTVESWAQGRGG